MLARDLFCLSAVVFCWYIVGSSSDDKVSIYRNCNGLSDGSYFMRLIDDEDYPIVNVKCNNEYMILDVNYDSELKSYFNTWFDYHYGLSGPARYDAVNWEKWFLVDSASSSSDSETNMMFKHHNLESNSNMDYKPSQSCSTCDMLTYKGEIESESVGYYMSTDTRMCMGEVAGYHGFYDHDWDTYQCYAALASELSKEASTNPAIDKIYTNKKLSFNFKLDDLTNDEDGNDWYVGFCGTLVGSSNYQDYNKEGYDGCGESKSNFAPSIGSDGRFCVCAKSQEETSNDNEVTYLSRLDDQVSAAKKRKDKYEKAQKTVETEEEEEESDNSKEFFLYQSDFKDGTYRIKESGTYTIMEDIIFDFNSNYDSPNDIDSWMPDTSNEDILNEYSGADGFSDPYQMGFFTGIAVEVDNVIINLNGKTIKQSDAFYFQQGFFSCIELANQIFLPGQPIFGFFGANFQSVSNVIIKDGTIGLSSHMGIHGNMVTNVEISNVHIRDFTTHGVQINGYNGLLLKDVEIGPSSTQYWATTQYIHTRFLLRRFRLLSEMNGLTDIEMSFWSRDDKVTMQDLIDEAEFGMDLAFNYYYNGILQGDDIANKLDLEYNDKYGDTWINAKSNFIKEDGLPYGSALYGMFLNVNGASVQGYHWFDYDRTYSQDVSLINVKIHDLEYNGYESVTLRSSFGQYKSSFAGPFEAKTLFGLTSTSELTSDMIGSSSNTAMSYKGSTYYDLLFALYHITDGQYVYSDSTDLTLELQYAFRMVLFIPPTAMNWALNSGSKQLYSNDDSVANGYVCAHDNMFHPMKGVNGLRLEGAKNVQFNNVEIYNLYNYADLGSEVCDDTTNHLPIKTPFVRGYAGNNIGGIDISYAQVTSMLNVNINNLHSQTGSVSGIRLNPGADVTFSESISINNLYAGSMFGEISNDAFNYENGDFPNSAPEVCGIKNNDLTDDELTTVNYKSYSPVYNEIDSMTTSCLSGKVGCAGSSTQFTHVGDFIDNDNNNQECSYNVDISEFITDNDNNDNNENKNSIILNTIIKYSDKITSSKYGLYITIMISLIITVLIVFALTSMKKSSKQKQYSYHNINSNTIKRPIQWTFNYYNSV